MDGASGPGHNRPEFLSGVEVLGLLVKVGGEQNQIVDAVKDGVVCGFFNDGGVFFEQVLEPSVFHVEHDFENNFGSQVDLLPRN